MGRAARRAIRLVTLTFAGLSTGRFATQPLGVPARFMAQLWHGVGVISQGFGDLRHTMGQPRHEMGDAFHETDGAFHEMDGAFHEMDDVRRAYVQVACGRFAEAGFMQRAAGGRAGAGFI